MLVVCMIVAMTQAVYLINPAREQPILEELPMYVALAGERQRQASTPFRPSGRLALYQFSATPTARGHRCIQTLETLCDLSKGNSFHGP